MVDRNGMALLERICEVERQLLDLRRSLRVEGEPLPAQILAALEVRIGGRGYLIPVATIREVVAVPAWQRLAESPTWVLGTIRYGTQIAPLIDARQRIDAEPTTIDASLLVIIAETPALVGLLVESVGDVLVVSPDAVVPPRAGVPQAPFLLGALADDHGGAWHVLSVSSLAQWTGEADG